MQPYPWCLTFTNKKVKDIAHNGTDWLKLFFKTLGATYWLGRGPKYWLKKRYICYFLLFWCWQVTYLVSNVSCCQNEFSLFHIIQWDFSMFLHTNKTVVWSCMFSYSIYSKSITSNRELRGLMGNWFFLRPHYQLQ